MRLLAVLAVAACLGACNAEQSTPPAATETPEAAAPADPNALTAEGWGPLRIGMSLAEITTALGPDANPDAVGGPDEEACDQFRPERAPEGMLLMVENGLLTRISLLDASTLKTDHGFGVGDTADEIKAALGDAVVATPHAYIGLPAEYLAVWRNVTPPPDGYVRDNSARGVVYETNAEGIVQLIHAGGPSIQYVEGCA